MHSRFASSTRSVFTLSALATALALAMPARAQTVDAGLTDLGFLAGGSYANVTGMSLSGDVIVGLGDDGTSGGNMRAWRWTAGTGMQSLGLLSGGTFSGVRGINTSGTAIVGLADDSTNATRAFLWTQAGGMVNLGIMSGGSHSTATGVSAAGDVVVGFGDDGASGGSSRAFRWTQSTGMVSLGALNGGSTSAALAISAAGDVIAGNSADGNLGNGSYGFRWTQATGMVNIGALNGGVGSTVYAMSADGTVIVGAALDGALGSAFRAFRWDSGTGMSSLGVLNGGNTSQALAVSGSGEVIVGMSTDGAAGNAPRAFRWTQASGMQSVETWLTQANVAVSPSLQTMAAQAVNGDGTVISGLLSNGRPFIARLVSSSAPGGLMDVTEFSQSLRSAGQASSAMPLRQADLVVHGAHGAPMQAPLASGKSSFWAAGDVGATDRGTTSDYSESVAEVGFGHGASDTLQIRIALGRTTSRQSLWQAGSARTQGTFIVPELVWQASTGLFATVTGYYNDGKARVRRGYLNAGLPDISVGATNTSTTGLRFRLDALNFWTLAGVDLTPYTSVTFSRTKSDAYQETGGGFPVLWSARSDKENVLRAGLDGTRTLGGDVRLTGRVELAHRFGSSDRAAAGEVIGLFPFQTPAAESTDQWARLGAGIDLPLGRGRLAATLNATTRGGDPAYWLATSYRVSF